MDEADLLNENIMKENFFEIMNSTKKKTKSR